MAGTASSVAAGPTVRRRGFATTQGDRRLRYDPRVRRQVHPVPLHDCHHHDRQLHHRDAIGNALAAPANARRPPGGIPPTGGGRFWDSFKQQERRERNRFRRSKMVCRAKASGLTILAASADAQTHRRRSSFLLRASEPRDRVLLTQTFRMLDDLSWARSRGWIYPSRKVTP